MSLTLIIPFVLLQIATVVAIVMFLRLLLHKQLEVGMVRIKKLDKENLTKESALNDKLEKINREYGVKIASAEKQASEIIAMAKDSSLKMRDTARTRAKEEAKRIIASAIQEKDKVIQEAHREISLKSVDKAALILRQVFSEEELEGLRCEISKDVIIGLLKSGNVQNLIKKDKDIEIITADKLQKEDEEFMVKIIEDSAGKKKNVKFKVDQTVLGGLILKIDESIIDGGIAYRIQKTVIRMKDEIV
ncbi:MAG: F0F1 ATP synthase subunit delta [Candidatus Omnitrophica bacterium]|nr:F0F1 ATP synthase subunit delta [Candidatus Omnitrophota bacterium]MBU1895129.1 F0F1 ATP synthase subunit delta [Candidatus Omnitrophota bacterium]